MAHDIPTPVAAAYEISLNAVYDPVSSGLINSTWLVRDGQRRLVLQKLSRIFDRSVNETIDKVSKFLSDGRARTTTLQRTMGGTEYVLNGDDCWRCLSFVPGLTYSRVPDEKHALTAGQALARFHSAMLNYPERQDLPHITVHDLSRHRDNLITTIEDHRQHKDHAEVSKVAEEILLSIEQMPELPVFPLSVLHGDPKISNFIFDEALQTACMIDLDTVGQGQILSELGDAFRSWCNPAGEDTDESYFDLATFVQAINGYLSVSDTPLTVEQGQYIGDATQMICLELAARFCADALQESYFAWDKHSFARAGEHQILRARGQLCLAKSVSAQQSAIAKAVEIGLNKVSV